MVYEYNLILLCLKIGNVSDVKKYCPLGYHYILKIRTNPKEKSRYIKGLTFHYVKNISEVLDLALKK